MSSLAGFDPERHARRLAPAGAVLAVAGGCLGGWPGLAAAAVGLSLLLLACVSRADGLLVVGPFARAEWARAARRRRLRWWRVGYALTAAALAVACLLPVIDTDTWEFTTSRGAAVPVRAERFFQLFAGLQFVYLTFLSVQFFAAVVAEERAGRRWDLLLTTDLRNREILLGKAAGRLPDLLTPVFATLPILAMLPLFGGVSPRLAGAAAGATLAGVLGAAGVGFFYSVFSRTAGDAVRRTLGLGAAYGLIVPGLYMAASIPGAWHFPASVGVPCPVEVADVVRWLNAGNPVAALVAATDPAYPGGPTSEDRLVHAVGEFAVFQGGVLALFGLLAVARLRTCEVWGSRGAVGSGGVEERGSGGVKSRGFDSSTPPLLHSPSRTRPPVGDAPVYWWERYGGLSPAHLSVTNSITPRALAVLGGAWAVLFGLCHFVEAAWPWGPGNFLPAVRNIVLICLWGAAWPVWLAPAFRAARCVARERAADTLDGLRLTGLTGRDILAQKWRACATSELPLFKMLLTVTAAGVVTGLVPPLGIVGVGLVLPAAAAGAAAVGLACSVWAKTPRGAVGRLVGVGAVFCPGALLLPPFALSFCLLPGNPPPSEIPTAWDIVMYGGGLLLTYAVVGWVAWRAAVLGFTRINQQ